MNIESAVDQPVVEPQPALDAASQPVSGEAVAALDVPLPVPVSIRSLSLAVIAALAGLFVLHWAKAVFIPFMLGLVFSYALAPIVNWMESRRVPRAVGAAVLLLVLLAVTGKRLIRCRVRQSSWSTLCRPLHKN